MKVLTEFCDTFVAAVQCYVGEQGNVRKIQCDGSCVKMTVEAGLCVSCVLVTLTSDTQ